MRNFRMPSKSLIASYVADWIVILIIAGMAAGLNYVDPYMRPFSLLDLSISYPYIDNTISVGVMVVIGLIAPAIAVFVIVLVFVPGPAALRQQSKSKYLKRKLWELEKGWAGLALSLATAFFITQGMKNLFGKARPDLLDRCQPDVENIADYYVGGFGQQFDPRWMLVSANICQQTDRDALTDGFRSFPSGHSSFSWAGLLYLSLFICSKFAIQIPYLPQQNFTYRGLRDTAGSELLPLHHEHQDVPDSSAINNRPRRNLTDSSQTFQQVSPRNQAASPPNYLLIPAFIPIAVAIYVNASRYFDFYHHGFDIIFGSLIGMLTSWFAFRWYHLPLSQGQGWAWGPRSRSRAWGIAVGVGNYVGDEGHYSKGYDRQRDGPYRKRAEGSSGSEERRDTFEMREQEEGHDRDSTTALHPPALAERR